MVQMHNVKAMVKISSIFVAFLENMNFTINENQAAEKSVNSFEV